MFSSSAQRNRPQCVSTTEEVTMVLEKWTRIDGIKQKRKRGARRSLFLFVPECFHRFLYVIVGD